MTWPVNGRSLPTTPAGWKLEFSDSFDGSSLDTNKWWHWGGQPGGESNAWWQDDHVIISDSLLRLKNTGPTVLKNGKIGYVSGGVGSQFSQTYGRYTWRARVAAGAGISSIALLWPSGNVFWPLAGEIDMLETGPTSNAVNNMSSTIHYGANNSQQQQHVKGIDFTKWHVYDGIWEEGSFTLSIDGKQVASFVGTFIPNGPMRFDLQSEFIGGGTPPTTCFYDIDWVAIYSKV